MPEIGSPGMGMAKHRKSGVAGKSPKERQRLKREAEANERKAAKPLPHATVADAMKDARK